MKTATYSRTMFLLGLAGLLFSGYLSSIKFFTSTCAFNEPCPYFLGYPACYFGFGMFLIIFAFATLNSLRIISEKIASKVITAISVLGILFAGYFTVPEIMKLFSGSSSVYSLGLPTCTYGLVFYIIIFVLSVWYLRTDQNSVKY